MDLNTITLILTIVIGLILLIFILFLIIKAKESQNLKNGYKEIKLGMDEKELIALLGEPTSIGYSNTETKILRWELNESAIRSVFDHDPTRSVWVEIKDEKVIAFDGHNINKSIWT